MKLNADLTQSDEPSNKYAKSSPTKKS